MDGKEFVRHIDSMSKIGDVSVDYRVKDGRWTCGWVVNGISVVGWGLSPESAVEDTLQLMRREQDKARYARERTSNVHAYLYNPPRILR